MPENGSRQALESMHRLLLEALRHREQEIVRYLAILGPALGGFVWLLLSATGNVSVFVVGTVGVLFLLLIGVLYSLALGYNYRYITLELAKLEVALGIRRAMLEGWPRSPRDFRERYRLLRVIPWCTPPEVIKVFWGAFLVGIIGVTTAACLAKPETLVLWVVICSGGASLLIGLLYPIVLGLKLWRKCDDEPETWAALPASTAYPNDNGERKC